MSFDKLHVRYAVLIAVGLGLSSPALAATISMPQEYKAEKEAMKTEHKAEKKAMKEEHKAEKEAMKAEHHEEKSEKHEKMDEPKL